MKDNNIDRLYKSSFSNFKPDGQNDKSWEAVQQKLNAKASGSSSWKQKFAQFNIYYASVFTAAASSTAFTYRQEIKVFTAEVLETVHIIDAPDPKNNHALPLANAENVSTDSLAADSIAAIDIDSLMEPAVANDLMFGAEMQEAQLSASFKPMTYDTPEVENAEYDTNDSLVSEKSDDLKLKFVPSKDDAELTASMKEPEQQNNPVEKMFVKQEQVIKKDTVVKLVTKRRRKNRVR